MMSESSSGVDSGPGDGSNLRRRNAVQKKNVTRKFAKTLLAAKRSGDLHAIAEEWEKVQEELVTKSSDLNALEEKVDRSLLESSCAGGHLNLERLAKEMTSEAERNSAEVSELKKRVFQ